MTLPNSKVHCNVHCNGTSVLKRKYTTIDHWEIKIIRIGIVYGSCI